MPITSLGAALPRADWLGAYLETPNRFQGIIRNIFAPIPVQSITGGFIRVPRKAMLQNETQDLARGADVRRSTWSPEIGTYLCKLFAHEEQVTRVDRALYGNYLQLEQFAANRVGNMLMRREEIDGMATLFNTTTWPVNTGVLGHTTATNYETYSTADPLADVTKAHNQFIVNSAGIKADTAVLSFKTALDISNCKSVLDRYRYQTTPGAMLPEAALKNILMVDKVLIGYSYYDSANDGQTAAPASIVSDTYMGFYKTAAGEDPFEPCVGRTPYYTGQDTGGLLSMYSYGEDRTISDIAQGRQCIQQLVMDKYLGYLVKVRP